MQWVAFFPLTTPVSQQARYYVDRITNGCLDNAYYFYFITRKLLFHCSIVTEQCMHYNTLVIGNKRETHVCWINQQEHVSDIW